MLSMGAEKCVKDIEDISVQASKQVTIVGLEPIVRRRPLTLLLLWLLQYSLEQSLDSMRHEWMGLEVEIKDYKSTKTFVVGGLDDVFNLLDEHIVKTQTMRSSPFVGGILSECLEWEVGGLVWPGGAVVFERVA
jgi:hypothetical protein